MKGLSFSAPMMIAWLSGTKTLTRRLIKPQPRPDVYVIDREMLDDDSKPFRSWLKNSDGGIDEDFNPQFFKPRYRPGETVYIRETWAVDKKYDKLPPSKIPAAGIRPVYYKALYDDPYAGVEKPENAGRWRSPRFMPEWAARSYALIKSVRPERVQEITTREIIREGFPVPQMPELSEADKGIIRNSDAPDLAIATHPAMQGIVRIKPREWFSALWDRLHPGSWERNDWVWRIELEQE